MLDPSRLAPARLGQALRTRYRSIVHDAANLGARFATRWTRDAGHPAIPGGTLVGMKTVDGRSSRRSPQDGRRLATTRRRLRVLATTRRLRPASGSVARSERQRLRPGLFVYGGGTLWRHWRQPVPDHLRRTKAGRGWLEPGTTPRIGAKVLGVRLLALLGTRLFWVDRRGSTGRYSLVVAAARGDRVLIDPVGGRVARVFADHRVSADQIDLRRRWSTWVPSPQFEVLDEGRILIEEYVEGEHPASLDPAAQVTLVRRLFQAHAELVRHEGEGTCRHLSDAILDADVLPRLPTILGAHLDHPSLFRMAARWPLVPAPGTVFSGNHIIRDHAPVVVDCMPLDLRPFLSVPVELLASWSRTMPHLREVYLQGGFDQELTALFTGAGLTLELNPAVRRALLAFSIAVTWGGFDAAFLRGERDVDVACRKVEERAKAYGLDRPGAWSPTTSTRSDSFADEPGDRDR